MGSIAAASSRLQPFLLPESINHRHNVPILPLPSSRERPDTSMSQGFHQGGSGVYGFSDDHRRDKQPQLRTGSFVVDPTDSSLIGAQNDNDPSIYDVPSGSNAASGINISDMFAAANFPGNPGVVAPSANDLLASQISSASNAYRFQRQSTGFSSSPGAGDWYSAAAASRQQQVSGCLVVPSVDHSADVKAGGGGAAPHFHQGLQSAAPNAAATADSSAAAAMRLFLSTNPQASTSHQRQLAAHHQQHQQHHQRSQSPPSPSSAAALPPAHTLQHQTNFHSPSFGSSSYGNGGGGPGPPQLESGQGLSLSLSSSLQQFELGRPDDFRNRDRMLYYSSATGAGSVGRGSLLNPQQPGLHQLQQNQQQGELAAAGSLGVAAGMSVLRHSKYTRAAQELLEEFCSVGKGARGGRDRRLGGGMSSSNPNPSSSHAGGGGGGSSSTSPKAEVAPTLSPADRFEQQRRKAKLLAMLDEVERRYQHYCEQMQMVVNSYDSIMGFGASTPYTALAQRAMSRHFRCLKDAIAGQLKKACELLGDKDAGVGVSGGGITKGETPKLRILDQSLRQQRAFHQMGMMEHEAWRPQRGLPERSVNILRGWLFEHFLHPYPSDADKHMLARQTGLSRNQVSNWFINARVRLWKPMVEEMYLMESKGEEEKEQGTNEPSTASASNHQTNNNTSQSSQTMLPSLGVRPQHQLHRFGSTVVDALDSPQLISSAAFHSDPAALGMMDLTSTSADQLCGLDMQAMVDSSAAHVRFGAAGDVSLTLGLRHAGNPHDGGGHFSIRDFGEC